MKDLTIIIPTHKRHEYLLGKIKYYEGFPCQVYICDSSPEKYISPEPLPANIHYEWLPNAGFYEKVLSILKKTETKFYNLTPDDDFLDFNTILECYEIARQDSNISLVAGKQVWFNKPYDGKFYSSKGSNRMQGLQFGNNRVKNAILAGKHYQNILWSFFRKDVILSTFKKLVQIKPSNGNFIELTLAMDACVGGAIRVVPKVLNYREYSEEEHWGKQVECITNTSLSSDYVMKSDLNKLLETYTNEERNVADAFIKAYLSEESRWSVIHILKAIRNRFLKEIIVVEEKYLPVERIVSGQTKA